jgi:hypothetical protein
MSDRPLQIDNDEVSKKGCNRQTVGGRGGCKCRCKRMDSARG